MSRLRHMLICYGRNLDSSWH